MKIVVNLIALLIIVVTVNAFEPEKTIDSGVSVNYSQPNDGAIIGSVIAPESEVLIKAYNEKDSITGTTNNVGEFFINGFEKEGKYTIEIEARNQDTTLTLHRFKDVEVCIGEATALGTVE